jgi:hypothetical protein
MLALFVEHDPFPLASGGMRISAEIQWSAATP